jgi:hypothetical protein
MPQGLQVWDASGTLLIDTSTYVLKEIVAAVVVANTTATQFLATTLPPSSTILGATVNAPSGPSPVDLPEVIIDTANSRLQYKFESASGGDARINTMAF